jgi:predicted LPLAT superfamily acyltransferase
MSEPAWKAQPERGTNFMLRFLLGMARALGRSVTRWLALPPTTLYFLLTAKDARRTSRQFLARAQGRPATLLQVARHIWTFASVIFDRMTMMLGGIGELSLEEHRDAGERTVTYGAGRGSLLFVSHLGSFEALRVVGVDRAPMKFLVDREHSQLLMGTLGKMRPELAASIIDTGQSGAALALAVRQALDEGYRVGMMVDRYKAGEKTVSVPFMGGTAAFPVGPWALAAALQARIVLGFCVFRGGNRYEANFELFEEKLELPRGGRETGIEALVRRYAGRLEHHARGAPYNWFNFYDFWNEAAPH